MNSLKQILKKIKSPLWVGVLVLIVAVVVIIFSSTILYNRTVALLTQNLRDRILTISITAADIDARDLAALQTEEDWKKPEWVTVVNRLHKAKYSNKDVVFMYIFRKSAADPTKMEFVADADSINPFANTATDTSKYIDVNRDGKIEPDGPDKLQWPGQPYPEATDIPETFEAYNGALTSKDIYTDDYGSVITGYAPIKDDAGNTVAVLASDVKANDLFTITTQTLRPFVVFIIFLTVIISILTIIIIFAWMRHAKFLEKSNDEKSEFISFASHQIRTPLTSIKGYASTILEGDYGEINSAAKDAIQKILVRSNDVVGLIGQYLNKSKMELGQLEYDMQEFDVAELLTLVVKGFEPNADQAKVVLTLVVDTAFTYSIMADKGKIKEALGNLIDNSIKYTPTGSVSVFLSRKDNSVQVKISDTGVGMSPETIQDLFKKFGRGKNAAKTNILGNGIGLYLAKTFIDAHKGKIWAESEGEGKGSQFYVELPTVHNF